MISLPHFEGKTKGDATAIELNQSVTDALEQFTTAIASMYKQNSFHNFEHASHVSSSTLLTPIMSNRFCALLTHYLSELTGDNGCCKNSFSCGESQD